MKALKIIGIILLLIVVLLGVAIAVLPSKAHVERSIVINSKPTAVYSQLVSMKKFNQWSPWAEIDPKTEYVYEGPDSGVGSKMNWKSDHKDVGTGSQWIVEAIPDQLIKSKILFADFDEPSEATLILEPQGENTEVTWAFDSDFSGIWKLFALMMDGELGPYYERGLAKLKNVVETLPQYAIKITEEETGPIHYIGIKSEVPSNNLMAMQQQMAQAYGELMNYVTASGQPATGMPICVYHDFDGEVMVMEPAIPMAEAVAVKHDKIEAHEIGATKVVKGIHFGDYKNLYTSHDEMRAYIQAHNLSLTGSPWEQYVNDPATVDTVKWETHIYYPVN